MCTDERDVQRSFHACEHRRAENAGAVAQRVLQDRRREFVRERPPRHGTPATVVERLDVRHTAAEDDRTRVEDVDNDRGSNEFIVAGSRSRTGLPLIANDPHLLHTAPSIWYENQISAPGFTAIGASFAIGNSLA